MFAFSERMIYDNGKPSQAREIKEREQGGVSMSEVWNMWHGCHKLSQGCRFCPVFQKDYLYGRNPSVVFKTKSFDLPVQQTRSHTHRLNPDDHLVRTCTTSDFFIEEADPWRDDAWDMIRQRPDLTFLIVTKRPERISSCLPRDFGEGWNNVAISCSCETQYLADRRLRYFIPLPIRHKLISVEPILGPIHLKQYFEQYPTAIEGISCGGEIGSSARICDYGWVLDLMLECTAYNIPFRFTQPGSRFRKGQKVYCIDDDRQKALAEKSGACYRAEKICG